MTLIHALEPPGRLLRALYRGADEFHSVLVQEWKERLERLAGVLQQEGFVVSTRLLEEKPIQAMVREVMRSGHDLLLKSAEGVLEGPLFGSLDMQLLRKCPCAVWIVRPGCPPARRILVAIDPDPRDDALNRGILQMATYMAESRGATLDVLHVWQLYAAELLANRLGEEKLKHHLGEARDRAKHALDRLLQDAGVSIPERCVHPVRGDAIRAIPEFASRHDIGLIVMGTVCRIGLSGFLIGSTAEGVLARVSSSVLTVKPEGFVSPILLDEA